MTFIPRRTTFLALSGLAVLLGVACSFKIGKAQNPDTGSPFPASDNPLAFLVYYDDQVIVDPAERQTYQNMANILNGYGVVPNARLNYYSAVNGNNGFTITGFQALITSVQPNGNGHFVTLHINPTMTSAEYGPNALILGSDYSEQYQVNNDGTFSYVGSLDPQGLAGQLPPAICTL